MSVIQCRCTIVVATMFRAGEGLGKRELLKGEMECAHFNDLSANQSAFVNDSRV